MPWRTNAMPDHPRTKPVNPPASSPCLADGVPAQPFAADELLAYLNDMLESERAGARGLSQLSKTVGLPAFANLFLDLAKDEGRFCVMLRKHIGRLGGVPSDATGKFYDKLLAREGLVAQLSLLDRGQAAVVISLTAALPRLRDAELHADLDEMLDAHVRNIDVANAAAAAWLPVDPAPGV